MTQSLAIAPARLGIVCSTVLDANGGSYLR